MHRNKSVDVHQFAMVPRADVPRSSFRRQSGYKTTFDSGYLVPVFVDEVLPGDTFNLQMTAFARLATPLFPIMDNVYLESFFFFVPCRLLWVNWVRFMGEQPNPADSISFTVPIVNDNPAGGYAPNSVFDYFGLPTAGQVSGGVGSVPHIALPLRAYNLIWNTWFRDENLQNSVTVQTGDGPDGQATYTLLRRGKRHDYFTSCLPWTQKGGTAISLPLTGNATVRTNATDLVTAGTLPPMTVRNSATGAVPGAIAPLSVAGTNGTASFGTPGGTASPAWYPANLYADLSTATATTINALRLAFQSQRFLERDARGGTRYTELVRSHFGVVSPDARLQRPEYLGGGSTPVSVSPIPQTSNTAAPPTPLGTLGAMGTALARGHGFSQSFTEHGYVIGLVNVRADLTYQQGLRRMWSRSTRFDFYWPVFSALGEQAVLNKEIFCAGVAADNTTFGFQERYGEYRYFPSMITGLFRSTSAGTLDPWHLAQRFTVLPTLNTTFIEDTPPMARVKAVPAQPDFLLDCMFDIRSARPMPLYGVPGLIDHL